MWINVKLMQGKRNMTYELSGLLKQDYTKSISKEEMLRFWMGINITQQVNPLMILTRNS
jgi:hypothetical protein